jgi:hypothetical protein
VAIPAPYEFSVASKARHESFMVGSEDHSGIRLATGEPQHIHHDHAAGQFRLGLAAQVHLAGLEGDIAVDRVGHGDRVGKVEPRQLGLGGTEQGDRGLNIDAELGERCADRAEAFGLCRNNDSVPPADIPPHEFKRESRCKDRGHGMRVNPHVEFSDRGDIADVVSHRSHDHHPCQAVDQAGIAAQSQGEVGERSQSDELQPARILL